MTTYNKEYYRQNSDKIIKRQQKYNRLHKEEKRQYDCINREKKYNKRDQWNKSHPELVKSYKRKYNKTKRHRETMREIKAMRRCLGFFALNRPFNGCEGHHISQNFVIYIPKEIHKALRHNIWTWKNMEQMNKLAIEFL